MNSRMKSCFMDGFQCEWCQALQSNIQNNQSSSNGTPPHGTPRGIPPHGTPHGIPPRIHIEAWTTELTGAMRRAMQRHAMQRAKRRDAVRLPMRRDAMRRAVRRDASMLLMIVSTALDIAL